MGIRFWLTICALSVSMVCKADDAIRIAVVASEDPRFYIEVFSPTIDFLREKLQNHHIVTREISPNTSPEELKAQQFDFLISPSGYFVSMDPSTTGLKQIATIQQSAAKTASESVGSVILCLKERTDIQSLKDTKNKRIGAYDPDSIDAWLAAKREFSKQGINTENLASIQFTQYRYPDVLSLLDADEIDIGILPTAEFERLQKSNLLTREKYTVINQQASSDRIISSTRLYPDTVFSSLPNSAQETVKNISVLLLTMPIMENGASWEIAHDFRQVLQLFQDLEIGPYKPEPLTFTRLWNRYRQECLLFFLLVFGILFHIVRTNQLVLQRTAELREAINQRDHTAKLARETMQRLHILEKRGLISQLSSMFAHELKQPLSTVVNYANGLKLYGDTLRSDPILNQAIDSILKESQKAVAIVNKVRSYAKSNQCVTVQKTSLMEVCVKAIHSLEVYQDNPCKITADLDKDAFVSGDALELELMVTNLLKNASDAVRSLGKDAKIQLTVLRENNSWLLSVSDNGPTIDDQTYERMSNALQQSIKSDGLGLGLMIVYAIAEKHCAQITTERLKPNGFKVTIRLGAI